MPGCRVGPQLPISHERPLCAGRGHPLRLSFQAFAIRQHCRADGVASRACTIGSTHNVDRRRTKPLNDLFVAVCRAGMTGRGRGAANTEVTCRRYGSTHHPEVAINVPSSALIIDQSGLHVATVSGDNRIALKQVTIARDLGKDVEIGSGLSPDDRVVQSPPDGIATGDLVRVAGAAGNPDAPVTALAK
jgi:hypothetical protein